MTRAALSALDAPDADAPIIDELAQASDPNPIASVLADAALLDLDRYATGRGLRHSRVGTTLMLAAPSDQRLAEAIDTVAAAAIGAGARLTDVTTQYIDEEKALASIGIDPWATRPSDEPTGQADRILYVGRDGARPCQSGPRPRRRTRLAACHLCAEKQRHAHCPVRKRRPVRRRALVGDAQRRRRRVPVPCEAPTKAPSSVRTGAHTPVGSSRKWPSSATVSGASAWPPASSARKSAAKSTSLPASPDATKPCTSPTRPRIHAWRRSLTDARTLDEIMGIEGTCSKAYFDALAGCVPADVTFDGRSRRPPRDLPNGALSYGYAILLSECVGALHAAGLEPSLASRTRPPTSGPAWRWTSWNSSAHSWSTRPSWRSCARANFDPNTASAKPRPGESGWVPTARKSSSTRTRPPVSDPLPVPSPDTQGRGADTSPTPRRCWRAPSPNPTTSGAGSPGDDLHHRLRHRRQQT